MDLLTNFPNGLWNQSRLDLSPHISSLMGSLCPLSPIYYRLFVLVSFIFFRFSFLDISFRILKKKKKKKKKKKN